MTVTILLMTVMNTGRCRRFRRSVIMMTMTTTKVVGVVLVGLNFVLDVGVDFGTADAQHRRRRRRCGRCGPQVREAHLLFCSSRNVFADRRGSWLFGRGVVVARASIVSGCFVAW